MSVLKTVQRQKANQKLYWVSKIGSVDEVSGFNLSEILGREKMFIILKSLLCTFLMWRGVSLPVQFSRKASPV